MNLNLNSKSNLESNNHNFIKNFTDELEHALKSLNDLNNILAKKQNIYIITDIDQITGKLNLINIENCSELEIYCNYYNSKEKIPTKSEANKVYKIKMQDFKHIDLASAITIENDTIILKSKQFNFNDIKNNNVKEKLEDMYFMINNTSNSTYKVLEINNKRIFLTDTSEGGKFSISKELYPTFKIRRYIKKRKRKIRFS